MNIETSALNFFYREAPRKPIAHDQRRPRGDKRPHEALSKRETRCRPDGEANLKHRPLPAPAYPSGLRADEAAALKYSGTNRNRKIVCIRAGNGRGDRHITLPELPANPLLECCAALNPDSRLFTGIPVPSRLPVRSARHIFERASSKAGVSKTIPVHSRRHGFAAHLLESRHPLYQGFIRAYSYPLLPAAMF